MKNVRLFETTDEIKSAKLPKIFIAYNNEEKALSYNNTSQIIAKYRIDEDVYKQCLPTGKITIFRGADKLIDTYEIDGVTYGPFTDTEPIYDVKYNDVLFEEQEVLELDNVKIYLPSIDSAISTGNFNQNFTWEVDKTISSNDYFLMSIFYEGRLINFIPINVSESYDYFNISSNTFSLSDTSIYNLNNYEEGYSFSFALATEEWYESEGTKKPDSNTFLKTKIIINEDNLVKEKITVPCNEGDLGKEFTVIYNLKNDANEIGNYGGYFEQKIINYKLNTSIEYSALYDINFSKLNRRKKFKISDEAFSASYQLKNITLTRNINNIGSSAFTACYNLSDITFNGAIERNIDNDAFINNNILNVNVDSIETWMKMNFSNYTSNPLYNIYDSKLYINGSEVNDLVIPKSITKISPYAFYNFKSLKSVKINDNIKTLDIYTFCGCENLINVTLGNKTEIISDLCFKQCSSLESIIISDSVIYIGKFAFSTCGNLREVTIGKSLKHIDDSAFLGCDNLNKVNVSSIDNWCDIMFYNEISNPLFFAKHLYFNNELVTNLIINKSINKYAFYNCEDFVSVSIVKHIVYIGESAFKGCVNISELYLYSLESWLKTSFSDEYSNPCNENTYVFLNDKLLENIIIPENISSIGMYKFKHFKIKTIHMHENVISVSTGAFQYCSELTGITCESVNAPRLFGNSVFLGIKENGILHYPLTSDYNQWLSNDSYYLGYYGWEGYNSFGEKEEIVDYDIKAYYKVQSKYATLPVVVKLFSTSLDLFYNNISEMYINDVKIDITDSFLFYSTLPQEVKFKLKDNTIINRNAFMGSDIFEIELKNTFTDIENYAFSYCKNLNSIDIPDSVTNLRGRLFDSSENLTKVKLSNSMNKIDSYTFNNCYKLQEIIIPDSVEKIGDYAFYNCSGLTSLTIGSGVTSINNKTSFGGCGGLESIIVSENNTVYDSRDNCNALIETSSNKLLLGSSNTIIPNTVVSIIGKAFNKCRGLKTITIPESIKEIELMAFFCCNNLESIIVLNNTVYDSRNNCNAIIETNNNKLIVGCQSTIIPESVISIGDYAFQYCNGLKSFVIPNGVIEIGNFVFDQCLNLTSITLSETVEKIGNYFLAQSDPLIQYQGKLKQIICKAASAPTIEQNTFTHLAKNGILYYPKGSDYSSWLSNDKYYLGYYEWQSKETIFDYDLSCTYSIDSIDKEVKLSNEIHLENVIEMYIDEELVELTNSYSFSEIGEHTIKYKLKTKNIAVSAFTNCNDLVSINFEEITNIDAYAFSDCNNLSSITTSNVKSSLYVNDYVFTNTNLKEITCYVRCLSATKTTFQYYSTGKIYTNDSFGVTILLNQYLPYWKGFPLNAKP